ncbi:MAG: fimbrial protein [Lysobacter sp.]|nr:fimbrial protein [Lysobacter sp.]
MFTPTTATTTKRCSGAWSGDYLNYLTTSRMDALRRVLYGGWRQVDSPTGTVLQGAFFPQDAHSWGKEYESVARDGYDIRNYAPLPLPNAGLYHLFAVTTVTGNAATFPGYQAPVFRVMQNTSSRVWNWLSIEGPVAGNKCFSAANARIDCVSSSGGGTAPFPGHPANRAAFDVLETNFAVSANQYGSGNVTVINCNGTACNPYGDDDEYLSIFEGSINLRNNNNSNGTYQFRVNGDEAIDFELRQPNGTLLASAGCYGARGFGACGGGETSAVVTLAQNTTYGFKFRQEEATGGDGYLLEWQKISGNSTFGWRPVTNDRNDANNNGNFTGSGPLLTTYDLTPTAPVSSGRADYLVRVLTCPASNPAVRESTCKGYPVTGPTVYKPTGILHDYGENQKMYFGLITGSQDNNLEGGVLRKNISDFAGEIDPATGQIRTNVEGIVRTIDRLRMIGGGYNSGTDNLNSDSNWNWANGYGNCPSIGDRAINNGECRMWGNPLAEMMYESLRYFAGAAAPIARFSSGGNASGVLEETAMGLVKATWKDPYAATPTGLGYPKCAKPFQTLISDINPSYDGDLPGNSFGGATSAGTVPATISSFSASSEGAAIWTSEFGAGPRNVFIGEVAGVTDGAPTAKSASSFGNIRGLAPEEPTKGGTYYSASVSRFGRNTDINAVADAQNLGTYSIALASPLPKIEFPLNGSTVTLLPFAKTVSGTFGGAARKPTNTIVDFYVEQIVNLPGQPFVFGVNGGLPQAVFRINYEDVEQGNDHDMDAIVRYEVKVNAGTPQTLTVNLTSEYAAGSADQNIGYSISGTSRDGIYLEVRDRDGPGTPYLLNTPAGVWAGGCTGGTTTAPCNTFLGLTASRTFSSSTASLGIQLKDPLWYAAKYGGDPIWDADGNSVPDNYFLVTNPLQLRAQLSQAFDAIATQAVVPGNQGITGARISGTSFTVQPSFNVQRNSKDWTGNLTALQVNPNGTLGATLWTAQSQLPPAAGGLAATSRNILTSIVPGPNSTRQSVLFRAANLSGTTSGQFAALGIAQTAVAIDYGAALSPNNLVDYLRGDQAQEVSNGGTLRTRSSVLGDIVNSEPVISSPRNNYGYASFDRAGPDMFDGYAAFLTQKRTENRPNVVYVGANDGMFHALNGSTGREFFAYVPHGVLGKMNQLALPDRAYTTGRVFNHEYYVDGQTTVVDAKDGAGWKTVAVGTTGAGGKSVFAIDVSNVAAVGTNQVLWEWNNVTDPDLGYSMGKPLVLPLENGRWGAVFSNGYGGAGSDPILYVVDVFSGALIAKIRANDGDPGNVPDADNNTTDPYNGLGQITAIDSDADGRVDYVYGGDLQGNLWKFNLSAATASSWNVAYKLFSAVTGTEAQPITGGIRVSRGPGLGYSVFFGTGRYFVNGDNSIASPPQIQAFYGVLDNGTTAGTRTNLVAQTLTQTTDAGPDRILGTADDTVIRTTSQNLVPYFGAGAKRGWYVDLTLNPALGTGERFIGTPRIQNGKVFFATFNPVGDSCTPGGTNLLYGLDLISGSGALTYISQLPTNAPVSSTDGTGAVPLTSGAPITSIGVLASNEVKSIDPTCVVGSPGWPACLTAGPTFEQCQVVIYPGALVLPRPCGRQSWRQLR